MLLNSFFVYLLLNKLSELGKSNVSISNSVVQRSARKSWEQTDAENIKNEFQVTF